MPTYVHFVRHAQGFHNLSTENEQLPDPDLTSVGMQQCEQLCKTFPHHDKVTHLVASPMRRTLYTCLLSFEPEVKAGKVITALPEMQEVSAQPCDIGTDPAQLRDEFDAAQVDLSLVKEGWNDKKPGSKWAAELEKLDARTREARVWLRHLGSQVPEGTDAHIVAVSHGGILHFLGEDWDGIGPSAGTAWQNTEYRTYEFADPTGTWDANASLRETPSSWRRRRGSAHGLTDAEQKQIRNLVKERLEEDAKRLASAATSQG